MFPSELAAQRFAAVVHAASENCAVRPREIHVLKNAELVRLFRRKVDGLETRFRNAQHLAGRDFSYVLRVQQIECACFAGYNPGDLATRRGELAKIQRAESTRIADSVQFVRSEHDERIRAFALIERIAKSSG